ncbi:MAG: diguanylate cyclase (GGDEF)-like protein [Paraglaciecola sp.]|jgi:diguanylate cyclase (GGDEF)-like protein
MIAPFNLYLIKSKLRLFFLIIALIFGGWGMLFILFFNEIILATQGFVHQTLPKLDTANYLDMTARDIDSASQRLIKTNKQQTLSAAFVRVNTLLDRLEVLTAKISQEGGGANILSLNRASQAIRTQAQLVFQLSTQRILLLHRVANQSWQTKQRLRETATQLMGKDSDLLGLFLDANAPVIPPYRVVMDMLNQVELSLSAKTKEEVEKQQMIYLAGHTLLRQWVEVPQTGYQLDPSSSVLGRFSELFLLRVRQLQMDAAINVFLLGLEHEVAELSAISADYSQRVFIRFQNRAEVVLSNERRIIWFILGLIVVASIGLFLVHRWLVIQGFGNRLAQISEAMTRVPGNEFDIHVPVSGKDEIADMARALEGLLTKATMLKQLAAEDELTGISNRRRFFELTAVVIAQVKRKASPACLLMIDIDLFKKVNDTYGHAAGDRALQFFAQTCKVLIRPMDLFSRYGGEEFVMLLPNTSQAEGMAMGERIRHKIEALKVPLSDGKTFQFTLSIGLVEVDLAAISIETALLRTDEALYQAKAQGRNQLQCWQDNRPPTVKNLE